MKSNLMLGILEGLALVALMAVIYGVFGVVIPEIAGTFYDPPHGDDVEIEKAHRLHVPLEELDEPELRGICASGRINEECVNHARNFYIDEAESAAEYRRDMKEDR